MDIVVHPGEVLVETLRERGMSQSEFARRLGVSTKHVNEICKGRSTYSPELAVKMERVLSSPSATFWIRLLADYRLAKARGNGA